MHTDSQKKNFFFFRKKYIILIELLICKPLEGFKFFEEIEGIKNISFISVLSPIM